MAIPTRIGPVTLANAHTIAKRCANYVREYGETLIAVDEFRICWVTWAHNSAARKIESRMPESMIGVWSRGDSEAIGWELFNLLQQRR